MAEDAGLVEADPVDGPSAEVALAGVGTAVGFWMGVRSVCLHPVLG